MSRFCMFCGKGYQKANKVARGIGNRCARRTSIKRMANLRVKRLMINDQRVRVIMCSSCLKRMKKNASVDAAVATAVHSHTA